MEKILEIGADFTLKIPDELQATGIIQKCLKHKMIPCADGLLDLRNVFKARIKKIKKDKQAWLNATFKKESVSYQTLKRFSVYELVTIMKREILAIDWLLLELNAIGKENNEKAAHADP